MKNAGSSRILAFLWAAIAVSLISIVAAGTWNALIVANLNTTPGIPWAFVAMAAVLWLIWQFLGGRWWPKSTSHTRRALLRANLVSRRVFGWSLAAGISSIVALAGLWIVLVELTHVGGNPTIPTNPAYPALTVALLLIMGSLVSPLTEEAAFRGYGQVILERAFPGAVAIGISSVFFALWHGPTQGFLWPKLLFYFLVGLSFGTIAYFTRSILPAIPVHIIGDLTFFIFIWPYDAARPLVWQDGTGPWFWIHVAQAIGFTALACIAYGMLARSARQAAPPVSGELARQITD
ncbi:MAG: lysostaphin resistance A-like protein [Nitrososphaerota archaeon]